MKIEQLAANQFILIEQDKVTFQSYQSIIAVKDASGKVTLDSKFWDYSKTTGKYRNLFLNETKQETLAKIKAGTYTLASLN